MGSLGWARCYWCWRWEWNPYIPDFIPGPEPDGDHGGPLCDACMDRWIEGSGPPWQPTAVGRQANRAMLALRPGFPHGEVGREVFLLNGQFLKPPDQP